MTRPRPAWIRVLVALGCTLLPLPAHGFSAAGDELKVTRSEKAADCPDEAELSRATLALGARPTEPPADVLTANVELDRDETGYIARIATTGRKTGTREIRAPGETCAELVELTSVALAILFDLLPPEAPEPPDLVPPPSEREEPLTPRSKPNETPPSTRALAPAAEERFASATLYGAFAYGLLGDAVTGAAGAAFHLMLSRTFDLGAGGFWAPGRTFAYERGTVSVSLVAARIELAGWFASFGAVALGGRVELGIGSLQAAGDGFDLDRTPTELWLAPGAGAVSRLELSRIFALRAGISGFIPHRSQTFSVQGVAGTAFESSPFAVSVELGPELAFY
ncbi:MAG TPA: hypothetical protein VFZ53_20195 [Polyangiaceae bacterium]